MNHYDNFWIASEKVEITGEGDVASGNIPLHVNPNGTVVSTFTLPRHSKIFRVSTYFRVGHTTKTHWW